MKLTEHNSPSHGIVSRILIPWHDKRFMNIAAFAPRDLWKDVIMEANSFVDWGSIGWYFYCDFTDHSEALAIFLEYC
jgi:hypothetical protein